VFKTGVAGGGSVGNTGTEALKLDSAGKLFSTPTQNNTTGAGANVFISAGQFYRSTSSQRYKNTINDATHGLTELLALRPVTYKGDNDGDTIYGGQAADTLYAELGADLAYGNKGADYLAGGGGNDTLYGGQGDDSVLGEAGADEIWGNRGDDTLRGGGIEIDGVEADARPRDHLEHGALGDAFGGPWRRAGDRSATRRKLGVVRADHLPVRAEEFVEPGRKRAIDEDAFRHGSSLVEPSSRITLPKEGVDLGTGRHVVGTHHAAGDDGACGVAVPNGVGQ